MYTEPHTVACPGGIHYGTLNTLATHFPSGVVMINGVDPTDDNHSDALMDAGRPGAQIDVAAETGDPQRDRDVVHIVRGLIDKGSNPWRVLDAQVQPRLPVEKYNAAANALRPTLGLPVEGGQQVAAKHVESEPIAPVSDDMTVTSKWQVVALGELQQPGGVGATQDYNPVVDGPNPDGPNFGDNAGNSPEQEVALQTWVNTAIDLLNRGQEADAIVAQLAHDGCPNPEEVLQRAMQQPEHSPISDSIGQDPFEVPTTPDPSQNGQMEGLSQQPSVQAKVRIAGTTMVGTEIDRWEGLWGEGTVKIALDGGGTMNVSPDALEPVDGEVAYKHPVSEIQSFIDSMPKVEPTRPHIEARLANLELVRRAVRSNISKVGFSDQRELEKMDSQAADETALLKEILSNFEEGFEKAYVKASRRYEVNAFRLGNPDAASWAGHPKEAGAIWATENFNSEVEDDSFVSAAAHYASTLGMTGTQFQAFLAGAEEHRLVRTEEFTAIEPEITTNDGPAAELFV